MRTNILHSNLLGRLGNGLLKFVVLVVMVCNVSGAFATTYSEDKTYSEPITIFPTGDVITINPGVTLTINSEVTIMGNLINNGGTIIVGEGGVLTVTRNVTNTSSSLSSYSNTLSTTTEYEHPERGEEGGKNDRKTVTTVTCNYYKASINISGGNINVVGNVTNDAGIISIETTNTTNISVMTVNGNLINNSTQISNRRNRTTSQGYKYNGSTWNTNGGSSTTNSSYFSINSTISLTNGYLCVDGDVDLRDNSTITFAGSGIDDDIKSTLRVRNISGTEGNVTQSANALISLESGAKGSLVVEGTYTDNTTTDAKHPWTISDAGVLTESTGFSLYFKKYSSTRLNRKISDIENEIARLISEIENNDDIESYISNNVRYGGVIIAADYIEWGTRVLNPFISESRSFSEYLAQEHPEHVNAMNEFLESKQNALAARQALEQLFENLLEKGFNANLIAEQSSNISTLLPIELTSFTATATEYGYTFNWVTASEVENDYFTLEYSIDGVDFNGIDYVHGAGTTSETSEYTYRWDEAPEFEVVYFRLKQTDYNGEYSYSDVIAASRKKSSGANGTFRYGPLNLQIQDGELRYIVK